MDKLVASYQDYLDCLNAQDWAHLGDFVHDDAVHNDRTLGLSGYRAMLESDFRAIPDIYFRAELLVANPPYLAVRLMFNCAPQGEFLGLPVNGRTVRFAENVIYAFDHGKIRQVWSVIDKTAIEAQLAGS
jgi:predicted ester cyclase